ncbi:MAG: neutral/alkaline non-lysosomal ceramidase N-terminal domain-containing protein [Pirellulaceae bacterium]|nr:neutral/alkaline non-lysosomal ceramidase N-terminal domain-containing protein [Pirellulaceae bacterium]
MSLTSKLIQAAHNFRLSDKHIWKLWPRVNCAVTIGALCIVLIACSLTACAGGPQDSSAPPDAATNLSQWHVGTGRAKITPREPMWMAGYASRNAPFQDVLQDLWAKALCLQDAQENRLLLVTLDLVGINRQLSQEICQRLQERHGLQRSQIVLSTSHTHSGPVVGKNLRPMYSYQLSAGQQQQIVDYSGWLQEQILQAAQQAVDSRQPAALSWGSGTATFATNRRNNAEPEVPKLRTAGQLVGPVDHSVPVLVVTSAQQSPLAIVFGYACHATVLSGYRISGDYPGFAQAELEQQYPGCTAMFWAGCGADQNPLPRRTEELAQHYGQQLAVAVQSVLRTHELQVITGPIRHQYREVPLAFAHIPSREQLVEQTQSANIYEKMRAQLLLEDVDAGQPLSPAYPYPVQTWQFQAGPQWVHLGGEVVVDYAARIKSQFHGSRTWVTGYANDVMAYIPSVRVLREGGYEGATAMIYYGLPSSWSENVEQEIMAEVTAQLGN